jgi:Zn-dependent protease with chaperone function
VNAAFTADYFDGHTSARRGVDVTVDGERLWLRGEGVALDYAAGVPLNIDLPDGGLLVAPFEDVAGCLRVPAATDLAHRLEGHVLVVIAAVAGLAIAGWFAYRDGIPWLARKAADRLPAAVEADIAKRGVPTLDALVFKPTTLPAQRRALVRASFDELAALQGAAAPRLEFRNGGPMGANAFAIPGGVVIITDQLVTRLNDNDMIAAVLAHELGHLRYRHGTRRILQASIAGLISAAVFGDVANVGNLVALVPTVFLDSAYSRDNEREADAYAFELLRRSGRSPSVFGEALALLTDHRANRHERFGYIASHPATEDRIRAAEEASGR